MNKSGIVFFLLVITNKFANNEQFIHCPQHINTKWLCIWGHALTLLCIKLTIFFFIVHYEIIYYIFIVYYELTAHHISTLTLTVQYNLYFIKEYQRF